MNNRRGRQSRPVTSCPPGRESSGAGPRFRLAFTLTELIVAIGVTVILVLGIGRIFSMSKQTISIGQATAELNQYARTLERLMRDDFAGMTRDGFLVIRNERLGRGADSSLNNRPVYLSQDDQIEEEKTGIPRDMGIRRLDQIVFFSVGDYTSYQFPNAYGDGFTGLDNGAGIISRNDVAATARIWYGQALRSFRLYNSEGDPISPSAEIKNAIGMNGYWAKFADRNFDPQNPPPPNDPRVDTVNVYAKDWILARQAALLLRREVADVDNPGNRTYNNLSFAPSFIEYFNESNGYFVPPYFLPQYPLNDRNDYRSLRRRLSPGLVDIIDMDLEEVEKASTEYGMTYIESEESNQPGRTVYWADPIGKTLGQYDNWSADAQKSNDQGITNSFLDEDRQLLDDDISERWLQGQWIRMALATGRIRAESTPPTLSRYDQMLTHATLTPGCSDFEIAWSTGEIDFPSGDIVWYDIDQPANPYIGVNGQSQKERHERKPTDPRIWYLSEITPRGLTQNLPYNGPAWPAGVGPLLPAQAPDTYFAVFGYFVPKVREGGDLRFGGQPNEREDRSEVWPWPKMIRIRVTLHDPNGEIPGGRTFEYIFDLPKATRG